MEKFLPNRLAKKVLRFFARLNQVVKNMNMTPTNNQLTDQEFPTVCWSLEVRELLHTTWQVVLTPKHSAVGCRGF